MSSSVLAAAAAGGSTGPPRHQPLEPLPPGISGSALRGLGGPLAGGHSNGVLEGSGYMEHLRRKRQNYVSPYSQKTVVPRGKSSASGQSDSGFHMAVTSAAAYQPVASTALVR